MAISIIRKSFAWLVHIFTASGLVAGFMAILAINENEWRTAMLWLIVAFIIDAVDGTFARIVKVDEALPNIKGNMIDTVVDFVNYAVIPAYFLYRYDAFPEHLSIPAVAVILIVSAIYYGKEGMIYKDMYFVGFPVLWNIIAFYIIFVLNAGEKFNFFFIVLFGILHFVPVKFAYPSRHSRFQKLDLLFALVFGATMLFAVYFYPEKKFYLSINAYICAVYFLGMAVFNTVMENFKNLAV